MKNNIRLTILLLIIPGISMAQGSKVSSSAYKIPGMKPAGLFFASKMSVLLSGNDKMKFKEKDTITAMAVEFQQFSAKVKGNDVLFNWSLQSSGEISYFIIERSLDNRTFSKREIIKEFVPVNEQASFMNADNVSGITNDLIYYRVKIAGENGLVTYSNVIPVKRTTSKLNISIAPSPATSFIVINLLSAKEAMMNVKMVDNAGKTVLQEVRMVSQGDNTIQVSGLERFSRGVYKLQLSVNNEVITERLVLDNNN